MTRFPRVCFAATVSGAFFAACSSSSSGPATPAAGTPVAIRVPVKAPWVHSMATLQLSATVVDSIGRATGASITYQSSNTSLLTVSPAGVVTSVGPFGQASILLASGIAPKLLADTVIVGVYDTSISNRVTLDARPYSLAISAANVAYVTQLDSNQISRVNLPTETIAESLLVGALPTEVAFSSTGTTLYVTNQFSQSVSVVNVATNAVTNVYPVSGNPFAVIVAPGDSVIYVTTTADSLFAIRTASGSFRARLPMPIISNGLAVHDSLLFISTRDVGRATILDMNNNTVLDTLHVGGSPQGIVVSADGTELYIANENATLSFWNLQRDSLEATMAIAGPGFGLAQNAVTGHLYVTTETTGVIQVIDPVSRSVLKAYPAGGDTRRIAVSTDGSVVMVANQGGWIDFVR